jgi:hypothetical protein
MTALALALEKGHQDIADILRPFTCIDVSEMEIDHS